MTPKRSKQQIMLAILDLCAGEGVIKTRIVYKCNLNSRTARGHLDELEKAGLIEAIRQPHHHTTKKGVIYRTTQRGITAAGMLRASELVQ
jgi:predicted transcriptional regulator